MEEMRGVERGGLRFELWKREISQLGGRGEFERS